MPQRNGDAGASFIDGDARSAFEHGNELAQARELEAAEEAYRHADGQGHGTAAAYAGVFLEAHGDVRGAEEAYRRADQRGDGYGSFRLGLVLSRRGEWEAASDAWSRADERGKQDPPFDVQALRTPSDGVSAQGAAPVVAPRSAFASPVLIGAVTMLVTLVAVFLAYNANQGLPFVPTKQIKVDFTNGSDLVPGNDVREGGYLVGSLSDLKPVELPNGQAGAQATLSLNQAYGKVPVDSTVEIRPRSLLGLKYIDLSRGSSSRMVPDGGSLPLAQSHVPVQFEDIFSMFDQKTRSSIQQDLAGYGDALTARGSALNDTIASLPELFRHLEPVARYLSDPSTQLSRFLVNLNRFMGAVAPVAQTNARLFTDMATTWEAVSRDPNALESTIRESPPTLDISTRSLIAQQPMLTDFTTFGQLMTPATASLRAALPDIDAALEAGARTLARTPVLNQKLLEVMNALKDLARNPGTNVAINGLTATVTTLNPMVRYLGPFQTVCDYWNYWWTYLSEHLSEKTRFGFAQRALINFANHQQNSVGQQGAIQPANGQPDPVPGEQPEFLHGPTYGAAVDNSGNADCETGQRGYPLKLNHLDSQGRNLDTDNHTPGDQGPTFAGRPRVPAGETYSRNPTSGPQLPRIPQNP